MHYNCSQDWSANNEKTKSTMKQSTEKQKSCNIKGVQQNFMFSQCEGGGYLGGWGGEGLHSCILLKLLGII